MSHQDNTSNKTHKPFSVSSQISAVSDRFNTSVYVSRGGGFEGDKPDSNGFETSSPVTPLRTTTGFTNTSSSSSSSGSVVATGKSTSPGNFINRSHSEELSPTIIESSGSSSGFKNLKPGHRRSCSGPLIYSGTSSSTGGVGTGGGISSVSSNPPLAGSNVMPAGNICPSGKLLKTGMASKTPARNDILRSGTGNYGHGSIIRGMPSVTKVFGEMQPTISSLDSSTVILRKAMETVDPEEVKKAGNELYRRGQLTEALRLYDRAIAMAPNNVVCRSNRAAALIGMGRLDEAVMECEEAIRLDPMNGRVHYRLASLYLRLGHIENARKHLFATKDLPDQVELKKLQTIERHLSRSADARRTGDWKSLLKETDAAIVAGADSCSLIMASKAEALLRLNQFDVADSAIPSTAKLETLSPSCMQSRFYGILSFSYLFMVKAQVDMALGRFENAELAADKAHRLDPENKEVAAVWGNTRSVARARAHGKDLFNSGRFSDACLAYGEGLKYDPSNPVLLCNRAVCQSKLGLWEKSIEDCNQALKVQPNYDKALLRRAASYEKLERWAEAVRDYEVLRKKLPDNKEIAEALFHAQVAWKASRGEEVSNMKFGGEVERIMGVEQLNAAVSLPGLSVVYFMGSLNQNSIKISPFVDALCSRHPSVNFLKVDVDDCPAIAKAENVKIVPTFKVYRNGIRMKEMICPNQQVLEYSVRHYDVQK